MFLTTADYTALIDSETLDYVIGSTVATREQAEKFAQAEIISYLSNKYDTEAIFAATTTDRSQIIIMRMIDIALYNLFATQPDKMGFEIRELRYANAIDWLKQVAKGIITPELPPKINTETGIVETIVSWGSMKKNNMDY